MDQHVGAGNNKTSNTPGFGSWFHLSGWLLVRSSRFFLFLKGWERWEFRSGQHSPLYETTKNPIAQICRLCIALGRLSGIGSQALPFSLSVSEGFVHRAPMTIYFHL